MKMTKPVLALLSGSLLLGGCATVLPQRAAPGAELVGSTIRMEPARGPATMLSFDRGGVVRAAFGQQVVPGRYEVTNRNLCFHWQGAPRECWPYAQPFQRGQTRTITSDRGNVVRVTLL
jgi:hypothetical protein